jgi:uncharacterized membrane protein YdjX (TVP38/TMEM64 family)
MTRGRWLLIAILVLLVLLFFSFDLGRYLTLAALKENRQALLAYREAHPVALMTGFMALYVIQTALSLPGAAIMSLAAGALFGTLEGTICAVSAASCGATLAFLVTRYLLHDAVLRRFGGTLEGINRELATRGLGYLLFLRLVPLFPFFLVNLAAGLTRLPLRTFVVGTVVGIVPGGIVYVNAGASIATIGSLSGIASPRVIASFTLLGLFALIPTIYARMQNKSAGR